MKKIIAAALSFGLMLGTLTACAPMPSLDEGIVIDKQYHGGYMTMMPIPHTTANGMTSFTYIPMHHPEQYTIIIEDILNDNVVKGTIYVSENTYRDIEIGDYITIDEGTMSIQEPEVVEVDN